MATSRGSWRVPRQCRRTGRMADTRLIERWLPMAEIGIESLLAGVFPEEQKNNTRPDGYLWARTVVCPYCEGLVPLSPNWRLASDGTGVRLKPGLGAGRGSPRRECSFEIVENSAEQSLGTVSRGAGDRIVSESSTVTPSRRRRTLGGWASSFTPSSTKSESSTRLRRDKFE